MGAATWIFVGFIVVLIGMFIIMAAALYQATGGSGSSKAEAGGVVMIGPIPIVFGTSWRAAIIAMALAVVLMVIAVVMMLLAGRALQPPPSPPTARLLLGV